MSDIKNLITAKAHDPYREFEIVNYLTCIENAHKAFFKFMAEQGYELYKKKHISIKRKFLVICHLLIKIDN